MHATVAYIRSRTTALPKVGVVLGSGLGDFAEELSESVEIPYDKIPDWPASTAAGHAGKLVFGKLAGIEVVVMAGRGHLYEGYTPRQVVFGVRILGRIGVETMVFTNAAGGINPAYGQGALVLISDHINLQGSNPLAGPNEDELGPRFPDMSDAYTASCRAAAKRVAAALNIHLFEGVYAAMLGPSYETPAEIRYLRGSGADLVGMSTVPEVIAANHMGMRVLAVSCVTNMAAGILPQKIEHEEVLETGRRVRGTLTLFLKTLLPELTDG
ncbi:MAG: purine-nucleoside phosphorylase [Bryobacteraceae bacterium]